MLSMLTLVEIFSKMMMYVTPPGSQISDKCKRRHLVAKFPTIIKCKWRHLVAKSITNASGVLWRAKVLQIQVAPPGGQISDKCMWRHLLTKFASFKVPPVMVSTHGSVVPLAMFINCPSIEEEF